MCLSKLDPKITITSGMGYKYVQRDLVTYRSTCTVEPIQLKMDEWVHDSKPLKELLKVSFYINCKPGFHYKPGFHLNLMEADAKASARRYGWLGGKVVKVRFHHVVAQGEQSGFPVIVARCIKVVK